MVDSEFIKKIGFKPSREFGEALKVGKHLFSLRTYSLLEIESELRKMLPKPKIEMGESKPFSKAIDVETEDEIENLKSVERNMVGLMKCPVVLRGAIMPDACPAGSAEATIPVGGVIEVDNAIIPAAHSADICCSMRATFFTSEKSPSEILDVAMKSSRFGAGGRAGIDWVDHDVLKENIWDNKFLSGLEAYAYSHLGTCGASNHFLTVGSFRVTGETLFRLLKNGHDDKAEKLAQFLDKTVYCVVTHFGSRGFGAQIYKKGVKEAEKQTNRIAKNIPKACQWIPYDSENGKEYWEALQYSARWTKANHEVIHDSVMKKSKSEVITSFGNEHNFVFRRGNSFFHAKGSTPAQKGEIGIIPMNMRDGILLTIGKGNEEFLSFAPHGAGRNLSRTKMKSRIENESSELENQVDGLDIRWYSGKPDISETAIAYKSADKVIEQIEKYELSEIFGIIKPYGCIMAGEQEQTWKKKKNTNQKQTKAG